MRVARLLASAPRRWMSGMVGRGGIGAGGAGGSRAGGGGKTVGANGFIRATEPLGAWSIDDHNDDGTRKVESSKVVVQRDHDELDMMAGAYQLPKIAEGEMMKHLRARIQVGDPSTPAPPHKALNILGTATTSPTSAPQTAENADAPASPHSPQSVRVGLHTPPMGELMLPWRASGGISLQRALAISVLLALLQPPPQGNVTSREG